MIDPLLSMITRALHSQAEPEPNRLLVNTSNTEAAA
jgi:hypothetical protein